MYLYITIQYTPHRRKEVGRALMVFNTMRLRQDDRHFADDIFTCMLLNENIEILIRISLKFVPGGSFDNKPSLVHIMAWRRTGVSQANVQAVEL